MPIAKGYKTNFQTLLRAAGNGDLALIECQDAATKKPVITICAIGRDAAGNVGMTPLAKLFDGNPYEELIPPGDPADTLIQSRAPVEI